MMGSMGGGGRGGKKGGGMFGGMSDSPAQLINAKEINVAFKKVEFERGSNLCVILCFRLFYYGLTLSAGGR
jgi:hypothetical protein